MPASSDERAAARAACSASPPSTLRKSPWIAALSSMTRMRRLMVAAAAGPSHGAPPAVRPAARGGMRALSGAVALGAQCPAELLRRERAAVQAEAMAGLAGREAVAEQPAHVLRRDADAVVDDAICAPLPGSRLDAERQQLVLAPGLVAGVLGVADQVDEDLQHLVLVDGDRRNVAELAAQRHAVARRTRPTFSRRLSSTRSATLTVSVDAAELRVALLHRHGVLDVLEVVAQRRRVPRAPRPGRRPAARRAWRGSRGSAGRASSLAMKAPSSVALLLEQRRDLAQPRRLRLLEALGDAARRDVDAVEDVADVVQHVGRDLGHARLARCATSAACARARARGPRASLGDVLDDRDGAQRVAPSGPARPPRVGQRRARRWNRPARSRVRGR